MASPRDPEDPGARDGTEPTSPPRPPAESQAYPPPGYPPSGYPPAGYTPDYPPGTPDYGYPPGAYPPPYPGAGQPQARGTNTMAILALVLAFLFAPAGIVVGHIAKRQIRQTGEEGGSLATAGLVLSYVFTGLGVLFCCIGVIAAVTSGTNTS